MTLRVGSLLFTTHQGIGLLGKSFADAGVVTDVVTVAHGRRPEHPEWYPGAYHVTNLRDPAQYRDVLAWALKLDALLAIETPFWWELFNDLRGRVPTFLMVMHECMPDPLPVEPDYFLCPSLLDWEAFPARSFFLPVPVEQCFIDRWRRRGRAETFVHNSGHGGLKGRNGTDLVLEAMEYVKSPAKLIVRSQESLYRSANYRQTAQLTNPLLRRDHPHPDVDDPDAGPPEMMVDLRVGDSPRESLYDDGDVFLFPEAFNGASLPLQESFACGMAIMCGRRFPMTKWLPNEIMIPVDRYVKERVSPRCREYDRAMFSPVKIAETIDAWYGRDVGELSDAGRLWAEQNSWVVFKERYLGVLSCKVRPEVG